MVSEYVESAGKKMPPRLN
jgi:tRNA(Met) C34 N-acetyltransferase TmcA